MSDEEKIDNPIKDTPTGNEGDEYFFKAENYIWEIRAKELQIQRIVSKIEDINKQTKNIKPKEKDSKKELHIKFTEEYNKWLKNEELSDIYKTIEPGNNTEFCRIFKLANPRPVVSVGTIKNWSTHEKNGQSYHPAKRGGMQSSRIVTTDDDGFPILVFCPKGTIY